MYKIERRGAWGGGPKIVHHMDRPPKKMYYDDNFIYMFFKRGEGQNVSLKFSQTRLATKYLI